MLRNYRKIFCLLNYIRNSSIKYKLKSSNTETKNWIKINVVTEDYKDESISK